MRKIRHITISLLAAFICLLVGALWTGISNTSVLTGTSEVFAADDEAGEGENKEAPKDGENPCPECPECPDPAKVVLRGLEEKKNRIAKEEQNLAHAKKELEIFKEQIDEQLESLKALKAQVKNDMALLTKQKTRREQEKEAAYEKKIGRLVKMYAGMKPKNAASIVDQMNLEVAQEIFLRMREASASEILSYVDSGKAAKISERLAFKRKK